MPGAQQGGRLQGGGPSRAQRKIGKSPLCAMFRLVERPSVPQVSVVITAYNQARWLGQAIDDVRRQTFRDWELVVVDDGSTDSTRAVVARYEGDPRVRYLFQPNQERSAARNRGVAATSGRLLAFLDADDRWVPDKLAKQVAALAASPEAAFCYTPARFVNGSGAPLATRKPPRSVAGWIFPRLVRANLIILASVVARRDRVEEVGGFDAALPVYGCEDWDLWLRLARRHPVAVVDEELTFYREHDGNTAPEQLLRSAFCVIDKMYADPAMAREAGISRTAVRARHLWYHAAGVAAERRSAAARLALESPSAVFSRPAVGALAALVLPQVAVRRLRGFPG